MSGVSPALRRIRLAHRRARSAQRAALQRRIGGIVPALKLERWCLRMWSIVDSLRLSEYSVRAQVTLCALALVATAASSNEKAPVSPGASVPSSRAQAKPVQRNGGSIAPLGSLPARAKGDS